VNDNHLDRDRLQALSRARGIANDLAAAFTHCTGCLQPACPRGILFVRVAHVLSFVFTELKCRKNGTTSRKYCVSTCS